MGHFHSSNLDTLLLNRMYAKGSISINDAVELAMDRGEVVSASEGTYDEKYMIQMSFNILMALHTEMRHVEPILLDKDQQRVFELWQSDEWEEEFDDEGESIGNSAILESILFKFGKGKRPFFKTFIIEEVDT